jgi:hypothetical protein
MHAPFEEEVECKMTPVDPHRSCMSATTQLKREQSRCVGSAGHSFDALRSLEIHGNDGHPSMAVRHGHGTMSLVMVGVDGGRAWLCT